MFHSPQTTVNVYLLNNSSLADTEIPTSSRYIIQIAYKSLSDSIVNETLYLLTTFR